MGWFANKFEKFRKLPPRLMAMHVLSKFVFGVGLGILLVSFLPCCNWQLVGWLIIVISIIIAIPSVMIILKRK